MRQLWALFVIGLLANGGHSQTRETEAPTTADHMLRAAEATASRQHKNVLVIFSASWCGPCHVLQLFLADPAVSPIFDKSFTKLILIHGERLYDNHHKDTPGADDLLDSLHDEGISLPAMVILNGDGKLLVDSVRPVYGPRNIHANIGFPEGPSGMEWFFEMLRQGAPTLTASEIATIRQVLLRYSSQA